MDGLNDFLNGCVAALQQGFGPFFLENRLRNKLYGRQLAFEAYLTLNLGLRYAYVSVPQEAEGRIDYITGTTKKHPSRASGSPGPGLRKASFPRSSAER